MTPEQILDDAAQILRDGTVTCDPVTDPVIALLMVAARRLQNQMLAWQHAQQHTDIEALVENTFGPELDIARAIRRRAGQAGGG